jgi:hypothetical protein
MHPTQDREGEIGEPQADTLRCRVLDRRYIGREEWVMGLRANLRSPTSP